ncbi:MAG: large conductance mechanosensitive channel protein MscL [Bacteroidota bacterium]
MAGIIQEFKEFAVKGNMIDIAVGVIIGAAFNKIIDVIVKEVLMPPLSLLTGDSSWDKERLILRESVVEDGIATVEEVAIGYGKLIGAAIDFLIIALTAFLVIRFMNRVMRKAQDTNDTTETTPKDIELLNKVAELLEKQNDILEGKRK